MELKEEEERAKRSRRKGEAREEKKRRRRRRRGGGGGGELGRRTRLGLPKKERDRGGSRLGRLMGVKREYTR